MQNRRLYGSYTMYRSDSVRSDLFTTASNKEYIVNSTVKLVRVCNF